MSVPAPTSSLQRDHGWGCLSIGASLFGLALCVGLALGLALLERLPSTLSRYVPLPPGEAALYRVTYHDHSQGYLVENVVRPSSEANAYAAVYGEQGQAIQLRATFTHWPGQAEPRVRTDFYARTGERLRLIAQHTVNNKTEFSQALFVWSPELLSATEAEPWVSHGVIYDEDYTLRAWQMGEEDIQLSDGRRLSALRIESETEYDGQPLSRITNWYVADIGLVRSEELDATGGLAMRLELITSTRLTDPAQRGALPTPARGVTAFFREDAARTGAHPDVGLVPGATQFSITHQFANDAAFTASPVAAEDWAYVADQNGDLLALDAELSAPRWRFSTGAAIVAAPALAAGRVFVGASNKTVYALTADEGLYLWSARLNDHIAASPVAAEGAVFVACEDHHVYALDAASGTIRWSFETGARIVSSPALESGRLFFGADDGVVYALEATTGRELWRAALDGPVMASPAVANGRVVAASNERTLAALDAATGESLWTVESRFGYTASPAVSAGRVFAADEQGIVRAVDLETGALLWEWRSASGDYFSSSPLVLGQVLVAIDSGGRLSVLDAAAGQVAHQLDLGGNVTASPTWDGERLLVATQSNMVLALTPGGQ